MNRRRFLEASAVVGAGLAAAGRSRAAAAKESYRIGVIGRTGAGGYGHATDTAWLDIPNCRVVGVADNNSAGRAAAAKRLNVEQTFADYRDLLEQTKPDIVCIGDRWIDQHRNIAVAAAERGMHVYLEKPFCRSLTEADEIVAACKKNGTKLAMAVPTRYTQLVLDAYGERTSEIDRSS